MKGSPDDNSGDSFLGNADPVRSQNVEPMSGCSMKSSSSPGERIMTADSAGTRSLQCGEVWGGNSAVEQTLSLPGLVVWLHSKPFHNASGGGDVYYFSVCSHGVIARVALADVSGHGEPVSGLAQTLRGLMHKYVNYWDQTEFMGELGRAFAATQRLPGQQEGFGLDGAKFATSTLLGYYSEDRQLLVTNAGHMPPLHYRAVNGDWNWLDEGAPVYIAARTGLPLGLIPGTQYTQKAFQLGPGDLVVLYTDGVTETANASGEELDLEGLRTIARAVSIGPPFEVGAGLLETVHQFGAGGTQTDDETLIVLRCEA
jgi:phosphoserine phosphatase RsbU/P